MSRSRCAFLFLCLLQTNLSSILAENKEVESDGKKKIYKMTACSEMHLHHKLYMIEAAGNFLLPTQQRHSATKGGFAVLPPAVTRENFSAATEDQTWCLKLSVDSELLNPFIYL